ncbi:autophagy-related protein 2 [Conoideocrella luteorostrata]|uniref:Autophagy-related protein 2 n=1 Tax=Conoideocrella luteorostrata TaxID=1105319 RepID=A0AAJ0FXC1_9HYPO|nr:autophagy-related protein 2 [Conoideocrella luteorostrata]
MAALFQSFRGSGMPKRLLRYALSRLDLLDAEALDLENLDLLLGRNTVFEFRDVGIKLKKLQKLLSLPPAFSLDRAKVLLLRITIPMDFYTSPITVEIDGVDVRLNVNGDGHKSAPTSSTQAPDPTVLVPNTADLAQSFLETEPLSERKQLEDALAAETNDLGASVTISDDGSEDDSQFGTGQPLSLPGFLTDFLQGIVDRTQVLIKNVAFQLDLEVPTELNSSKLEPVSFQIALGQIEVEGITAGAGADSSGATQVVHQEGKRHISLSSIRASLISEADAFAGLTRSPSTASPSLASSPAMTRNPPSRMATFLSQGSFHEQPMASLQESFRERLSDDAESDGTEDYPLTDSEDALAIPYDLSDIEQALEDEPEGDFEDQGPSTPRASTYLDTHDPLESSALFHSTSESEQLSPTQSQTVSELLEMGTTTPVDNLAHAEHYHDESSPDLSFAALYKDEPTSSPTAWPSSAAASVDNLAESRLYTHEEAESMYMSAFSKASEPSKSIVMERPKTDEVEHAKDLHYVSNTQELGKQFQVSELEAAVKTTETTLLKGESEQPTSADSMEEVRPRTPMMPGAWDDSTDSTPDYLAAASVHETARPELAGAESRMARSDTDSTLSSPAFSRASLLQPQEGKVLDDGVISENEGETATPKGPPKLVKEILRLDKISVYIQLQHHQHFHVHVDSPEPVRRMSHSIGESSIYPQAPGAFSIHSSSSPRQPQPQTADNEASEAGSSGLLDVHLSPAKISFDTSIAFLLAMVVERLLKAMKSNIQTAAKESPSTQQNTKPTAVPRIHVTAEEITVNFLNRLSGVVDHTRQYGDSPPFDVDPEVLLNMTLVNLKLSSTALVANAKIPMRASRAVLPKQGDVLTKIELEKFRFGYARGDILSFDSARQMSTSVKDSYISTGHDVGIEILQSGDTIRTNVETLPLVVQIDLQRLDETFGWFGGLSSFLNMSASMTSSPSPPAKSSRQLPPKSRGVRFDTPIDPQDKSATSQNKINLRIGGTLMELVGKDCSVAAETSALKLVSRDEGVGIGCSRLRISGPYLKNSLSDPAIRTEVAGMRLEFLTAPKDTDLEKLLELIIPSKVKFDHEHDEVMVDTLLRQRRKGSVLRATLDTVNVMVKNTAQLSALPALGEEVAKLSAVAKYLPEDDRPGLLTLTRVQKLSVGCELLDNIGHIGCDIRELEVGQITVPSLIAVAVHGINVQRNRTEELISSSLFEGSTEAARKGPVLMVRMIGDEIDPIIKLKLQDLRFEYRVATIMDFLNLGSDATPQDFEAGLAASVANLGDQAHTALSRQSLAPPPPPLPDDERSASPSKPTTLDVGLRDCVIGLNPYKLSSKLIVALTDAHVEAVLPNKRQTKVSVGINKASILLTNDTKQIDISGGPLGAPRVRSSSSVSRQVEEMCARGFVDICYISSAGVMVSVIPDDDGENKVEVEVRDDLLVLETCADSTQTLIALANALKPPTPPAKENKYRTRVLPVQDLLASISAEAFGRPEGEYDFDQDFAGAQEMAGSGSEDDFGSERMLPIDSRFFGSQSAGEELFDATKSMAMSHDSLMKDTNEGVLLTGFNPTKSDDLSQSSDDLVIHDDFYDHTVPEEHTAMVWNSNNNSYDRAPANLVRKSPLKVSARDIHVIWNLFDGYDWKDTRDVITKAVEDVEIKATERQSRQSGMQVYEEEIENEETIGDFLFNSIYIGIPSNRDPRDLTRAINEGLNDNATETESVATTTMTMNTNRTAWRVRGKPNKRLRLNRSKHHKITFELQGINADMVLFPPEVGETVSSLDVRIEHFDIFDHVPTSTWKKFATYDQDHGEREMGTSMIHIELLNVKPIPQLAASETVVRATVLPLRLHVDQDALDFITRFFEFKDDKVPVHASPSDIPFVQRAEVMDIPVKLDFKPKRVDYAGLRSGHTTEFMNFIVLEESRMVLRHVIIYGVAGFDRLGKTLNDIWMPDVQRNQLPGVVAGLAPVRSLVNIGSGFRDLVEIPLRGYQKDGRVIRSISKGAVAFARTTGTELVKLGAKIAVGTQYALQGAEEMLAERGQSEGAWEEDDLDPEDRKQISLYADQPTGVLQGIRGGFRSLARDVNLARDAIIAVPGEVMATQSAAGAAKAVLNRAPTIIFRPAVGVTKAIGQTLMGATNTLDHENRRRIGEKYKH